MNKEIITFFNNWKSWIEHEKRLADKTIQSYCIDLKSFIKFVNIHNNTNINLDILKKINEDDLSGWFFERLKSGVSHRSNARALSALKSFFSFLIKKKIIQNSKILNVKGPKFLESLPRPLTNNQIFKIIDEIKKEKSKWMMLRNLSAIILMWGYGLRISEALNLKLRDTYQEELRIIGKGSKVRIIPISKEIIVLLKLMLKECPCDFKSNDYIFVGKKGGKLKPEIIQRLVREIRDKLILPENTTPHSLRHTFATELLQNLVDLRSIQELLGHSSLSTTQKYTSVNRDYLRDILERNHPRAD